MTPEEAKEVLDSLKPGELEQLIWDSIISENERRAFAKRQAELLHKQLFPTSGSD